MPEIGEIRRGKDIGYRMGNGYAKFIWHACITCGKERWVQLVRGKPKILHCSYRLMAHNPCWRGGRYIRKNGYVFVKLISDDFFYQMADEQGYVREHRLVVAKAVGRNLHSWEIVHHKHTKYPAGSIEDKQDNRYPENLQLVTDDRHNQITILETKIDRLLEGQRELKAEIRLLRLENKQLGDKLVGSGQRR